MSNGTRSLTAVDKALTSAELLAEPRAVLLLKVCQLAQVFRPELVGRYWDQLKGLR